LKALSLFLIPALRQRTDRNSTGRDDAAIGNICHLRLLWGGLYQLCFEFCDGCKLKIIYMNSKILEKVLSHSKKTKTIIGMRKYNEGDDIYIGYVVDYNETLIVLQHVTKFGLEDGLMVEKIDNIESFETEDEYVKSYQLLVKNVNKIKKQTIKSLKLKEGENWQYELLKTKFDKGKIVTIELNNDNLVTHGFIVDFDETFLHFNPIDNLGNDEGSKIYKLSDISGLTIERLESRKRQTFYDLKKKNA